MIYKSHLSVVTFVGTLLMSAFSFEDSHGWQESARFCRERAMTLQRNGFQICQKYAFLDGGVFRGATNFRKDACLEDFGWVSFTNERNGTVVSAGFPEQTSASCPRSVLQVRGGCPAGISARVTCGMLRTRFQTSALAFGSI